MKSIYILFSFLFVILFLGCLKDEVEQTSSTSAPATEQDSLQVSNRNGQGDVILYRGSLSTDNYLIVSTTNRVLRTHSVYNKSKVAYLSFRPGTLGLANIGGVLHKHYQVEIKYKDSTSVSLLAFSKDTLDRFKFIPKGTNILSNTHPSKKVDWVSSGKTSSTINEFRNITYTNISTWNIYADGKFVIQKIKDPINTSSTQFSIPHSFK